MSTNTTTAFTSLRALAENKEDGITKQTIFRIDPEKIIFEEGFNLRTENDELGAHIERLYLAMKAGAFIPPIDVTVIDGAVIARDGHCRTIAAQRLRHEVPEYTLECRQLRGNAAEAVLHMLGTGSGSKPLTPLEQGNGFLRLIRFGLTQKDIAAKLGITTVTVNNNLQLAEASPEVQDMITSGDVSATVARDALKQGDAGVEALKEAIKKEKAKPQKGKKKNKVTAKKVKGTAAAKPVKAKKEKKPKKAESPELPFAIDPNKITISVDRLVAQAAVDYIRDFVGTDAEDLNTLRAALETAMM